MRLFILLPVAGASLSALPPSVAIPQIMLGTGGGGGGFDAPLWLSSGGLAFNTALAYCYAQFTPQCRWVDLR